MLLLIDHEDSFTYNLAQALGQLGARVEVLRARGLDRARVLALGPDRILLGPGPGPPERAFLALELLRQPPCPILGVCLGHQALAMAFGGQVARAPRAIHGETSSIHHDGKGVFRGLPVPFSAARYHSLALVPESLPVALLRSAWSEDGVTMGLRHRELPLEGVQFHPESIASEMGAALLANFLEASFGERVVP